MSVYRRGAGKMYYMDFRFNGQRVFRSTGKTYEVEAKAVELLEKQRLEHEVTNPKPKAPVLSDAIDRCYFERWRGTKDAEKTLRRAESLLRHIPNKPLNEYTSEDIQALKTKLEESGLAQATVNRHMAALKTVLNMGVKRWNVIDKVPYVPMNRERKGRVRQITEGEEQEMLTYFRNNHSKEMHNLMIVLIDTGMRLSEALSLNMRDVDFENGLITLWVTKSGEPRSIPMTSRVKDVLAQSRGKERPFYFTTDQVERAWMSLRKALKLTEDREFVVHALRHTFASRLIQRGVDLYRVKNLLGHSTVLTTERYAHLAPANAKDAVRVLEPTYQKRDF